ncbi:MAG: NYN domain-containing protein [Microcystaceae cyanobacterium]
MTSSLSLPTLLVDGYNIIGTWPSLQKTRDRHGLEPARRELVETLINYTAHQGYCTRVVFDAHYQKQSSTPEQHTPHLSVHFTDWMQTADTYIEKFCAAWSRKASSDTQRVIVATSDQAQRLTVQGYGAEWLSAHRLANEVNATSQTVKQKQASRKGKGRRPFLFSRLDEKGQERLSQLQQRFSQKFP